MPHIHRIGYRKIVEGYQVIIVGNSTSINKHFKLFNTTEQAINFIKKMTSKENLVEGYRGSGYDNITINDKYWKREESEFNLPDENLLCVPSRFEWKNKNYYL